MPSTKKTLHFLLSAILTAVAVGILGFAMSTEWASITMDCARSGSGLFNGTASVILKLFEGTLDRDSCPTYSATAPFEGKLKAPLHPNYKITNCVTFIAMLM